MTETEAKQRVTAWTTRALAVEESNRELRAALIDTLALLEHYAEGRPLNWDGSTKAQAFSAIRKGRAVLKAVR